MYLRVGADQRAAANQRAATSTHVSPSDERTNRRQTDPPTPHSLSHQERFVVGVVQPASRAQEPSVLVLHRGVHRALEEAANVRVLGGFSPGERGRQAWHLGRARVVARRESRGAPSLGAISNYRRR